MYWSVDESVIRGSQERSPVFLLEHWLSICYFSVHGNFIEYSYQEQQESTTHTHTQNYILFSFWPEDRMMLRECGPGPAAHLDLADEVSSCSPLQEGVQLHPTGVLLWPAPESGGCEQLSSDHISAGDPPWSTRRPSQIPRSVVALIFQGPLVTSPSDFCKGSLGNSQGGWRQTLFSFSSPRSLCPMVQTALSSHRELWACHSAIYN